MHQRATNRVLGAACILLFAALGLAQNKGVDFSAALQAVPKELKAPKRFALVIGANDYVDDKIPDLPACENDAKSLQALLVDPNVGLFPRENVSLLTGKQVTKRNIIGALDDLARKVGPKDLVLIFFSGHGATDERSRAYWVMNDTEPGKLRATALPESDVTELISEIKTDRLVTFIDACYSAATANVTQTKALIDLGKIYPQFEGEGRIAITASRGDQLSVVIQDRTHPGFGYSAFAWHLIEALRGAADDNHDGVITVDETWAYVKDRTERTSRQQGGQQQPQLKGQMGSRFLLTVDAKQLIRHANETKAERELREKRIAELKKLALGGAVSVEHFQLGSRLFSTPREELDDVDVRRLTEFLSVLEGKLAADKLPRALALIDATRPTPTPTPTPIDPSPAPLPPPEGDFVAVNRYDPPATPVTFEGNVHSLTFKSAYDHSELGGYGQYLVLQFKEARSLWVLDLLAGARVQVIEDVPSDALYAVGAEDIVIVSPGQRLVQRYNLKTSKRERIVPLKCQGTPHCVLLGANSKGPVLLGAQDAQLLDLESLRPLNIRGGVIGGAGRYGYGMSVSANGNTFTGIIMGLGPVSYQYMCVAGREVRRADFDSTSNAVRWAQPTADGSLLMLPGPALYASNLLKGVSAKEFNGARIFPTVDPAYMLAISFAPIKGTSRYITHFHIYATADRRMVCMFAGHEFMAPQGNTNSVNAVFRQLVTNPEQRFHYIPWANLLVTQPYDNKLIVCQKIDFIKLMKDAGEEFLFVDSVPPGWAARGQTLAYQITTKSSDPKVAYELLNGPPGATVSADGKLTWAVPAQFADKSAPVIVRVHSESGKEILHSFELAIATAVTETALPAAESATPKVETRSP